LVRAIIDGPTAARSDSPSASLAIAAGRDAIADPPAAFGAIRPGAVRHQPEHDRPEEHQQPQHARSGPLRPLPDDDYDDVEAADVSSPVGGGGAIGRLLQKLLRAGRASGAGQPGAETATHHTGRTGRSGAAAVSTAPAALPTRLGDFDQRGVIYPEWNVHERRYRPGWCTVKTVAPPPADHELEPPPEARDLRRPLSNLGMELERGHRQLQGDEIDIDAAVETRVDIAAGSAPNEAIYVDSLRRRRDLSALILLDVSGSAGEASATGATVHEHQRRAAAALTLALHDLGDRVALYGFRSQGRHAVEVLPVKRFDDGVDALLLRRLNGLAPGAYTRLGAAIRHGAAVLETDGGTPRRLLVVLSDGFAYDHGYDRSYGEADARMALAEARRRGTACLCISVAAQTDVDALRRVFGTVAHALLPRTADLTKTVGPLFRAALTSADAQRRVSQRRSRTHERLAVDRTRDRTRDRARDRTRDRARDRTRDGTTNRTTGRTPT
jgi:hypothetical protein